MSVGTVTSDQALPRDLDVVRLLSDAVGDEGERIPSGSEGTVVHVVNLGDTYVVEFDATALGTLATVGAQALAVVWRVSSIK